MKYIQTIYQKLGKLSVSSLVVASMFVNVEAPKTTVLAEGVQIEEVAQVSQEQETKESSVSFPVAKAREAKYNQTVIATAYSSDPAQTDATPCTPADGTDLCALYEQSGLENTIASNFLPLGTLVRFPDVYGDKVFVVRDRMNSRYNNTNRIDIWIGSATPTSPEIIQEAKTKAKQFGIKTMKMEIL